MKIFLFLAATLAAQTSSKLVCTVVDYEYSSLALGIPCKEFILDNCEKLDEVHKKTFGKKNN